VPLISRAARCGDDNYYTSRLVYLLCVEEAQIERERELMSVEQRAKRIGGEKVIIREPMCARGRSAAHRARRRAQQTRTSAKTETISRLLSQHLDCASAGPK
jgi:hypothetical protein